MIDEWDLSATNLGRLTGRTIDVALLPVGATEAHNRHLPEGQDVRTTLHVAQRACETAWRQTPGVICLPVLPYGVDCNLEAYPLTIHVRQSTLDAMVRDIIESLNRHGVRKIVIVNGHGGNDFGPLIRQLQSELPVHVFLCNWWTVGHDQYSQIFEAADDHAGEMETSVALALYPELVELGSAGDGHVRPFRFEGLQKGWVKTSREFARLNDHCAVGDPSRATAEKGRRYLDLVCGRLSAFLVDLAKSSIDEHFPHALDFAPPSSNRTDV